MYKKYLILVFIVFAGFSAEAQVRNTDISLSISPEYPSSNQNVNAKLSSYVIDLNKTIISWSINNEEKQKGIGKKTFSFTVGNIGSSTILSVIINTIDGENILKTTTLNPSSVDILWMAHNSYTPPFYRGKALVPSQGSFKVVAIPNLISDGEKININNLSYSWKKDDAVELKSSGWGKNYLIFTNSYLDQDNSVEVKISDISGTNNASGKITLKTISPKILFYKNDPFFGTMWEKTLPNGFEINPNGEIIVVEPYFFSPKNINSSELAFDWFLNKEKIETPNPKNILSIKPEAGQSGSATIKIDINNINTLFQSAKKQLSVSF